MCPKRQIVLTFPRKCPAETGSVPPSVSFSLPLYPPPLWPDIVDPVSSPCPWEYSGFVRHPNPQTVHTLLTCTYPRTCILGCDLFQCFELQSSTPAEISISDSPSLPTARQTRVCNEHTVWVYADFLQCNPVFICSSNEKTQWSVPCDCSNRICSDYRISLKHFCSKK